MSYSACQIGHIVSDWTCLIAPLALDLVALERTTHSVSLRTLLRREAPLWMTNARTSLATSPSVSRTLMVRGNEAPIIGLGFGPGDVNAL
jgi:hypothetical protein